MAGNQAGKQDSIEGRDFMPRRPLPLLASLLALAWMIAGCAALTSRQIQRDFHRPVECAEFFSKLDGLIREAGVRDASMAPVPGFPYLRTNRFLAALGQRIAGDEQLEQWLDLMRRADLESRRKELMNLPDAEVRMAWGSQAGDPNRLELMERAAACSERLYANDRSSRRFLDHVKARARVPDEYSTGMRIVGLHPLASVPVALVTQRVRNRVRKWYEGDMDRLPVRGKLWRYVPERMAVPGPDPLEERIRRASENPLSIPLPVGKEQEELLRLNAPELMVDVAGPYDRPGTLSRVSGGPRVDGDDPAVYAYVSHAFLRGKPVLQCNYVVWFPARAGPGSPWIERGSLDGLTVRISLDFRGKPFMVDIMNNCGCYHLFVPDRHSVAVVLSRFAGLDSFVPQWLPDLAENQRLGVRIRSGWHQVERVYAATAREGRESDIPYRLLPYERLESQPAPDGRHASMFNDRGIVEGSRRIEPLIFFPMGIPSIGSMRQRGRHAIDLIGREHFDNPYLFDERFIFR